MITEQMEAADAALSMLYPIDPYCILAGGAPRDWYFGNEAKDLDIFFHVNASTSKHVIDRMLKHIGFKVIDSNFAANIPEHYKKNPSLRAVYNIEGDVPVQLMLMDQPTFGSVIPKFPLSICKVWYKHGKTILDKDFRRGTNHRAIVKTNELYALGDEYLQKILNKYPDYRYYNSWQELNEELLDKSLL